MVYKPEYLMIQSGANAHEDFPIRLYNLSAKKLRVEVPSSVSAFHASNSLQHMDYANQFVSNLRSYYGAMTNRMEHTINENQNYAENLQNAESAIRDTDMATDMMAYSKNSILQQAAQAMITQSNQSNQGVLSLLQG